MTFLMTFGTKSNQQTVIIIPGSLILFNCFQVMILTMVYMEVFICMTDYTLKFISG